MVDILSGIVFLGGGMEGGIPMYEVAGEKIYQHIHTETT